MKINKNKTFSLKSPFTALRRKNKSLNYKVSLTCNYFMRTLDNNLQCDFDQNLSMGFFWDVGTYIFLSSILREEVYHV